jgi:hypothetical protein
MYPSCTHHVPIMLSHHVPIMYPSCTHHVPIMHSFYVFFILQTYHMREIHINYYIIYNCWKIVQEMRNHSVTQLRNRAHVMINIGHMSWSTSVTCHAQHRSHVMINIGHMSWSTSVTCHDQHRSHVMSTSCTHRAFILTFFIL